MRATTVEKTVDGTITTTYTFPACDAFVYALIVILAVQTVSVMLACWRMVKNDRPKPTNQEPP